MTLTLRFAVVLSLLLAAYPTFAATHVTRTAQRGLTASASSLAFDGNCVVTTMRVDASDTRASLNPGPPDKAITVTVGIQQFDLCNGTQPVAGFASVSLTTKQFAIRNDLNSARLLATVPVMDTVSGNTLSVPIDLSWTAAGLVNAQIIRQRRKAPGAMSLERRVIESEIGAQVIGSVSFLDLTLTQFTGELNNMERATLEVVKEGASAPPLLDPPQILLQTKRAFFATAQFGTQSGCIVDGIFVNAQTPPSNVISDESTQLLVMNLVRFDQCTNTTILSLFATLPLPNGALSVPASLENATLSTTVQATNFDGTLVSVTIELAWQATDARAHNYTRDRFDTSGSTIVTNAKGTIFLAAVTGTISTPLGSFSPASDAMASLGSQTSGTITIAH